MVFFQIESDSKPVIDGGIGQSTFLGSAVLLGRSRNCWRYLAHCCEINSLTLPIATKTGLFYCYVKAGEEVDNNQLLGEIKNLEGETLQEIKSPMSGIIEITVINPVIKAGDYVLAVVKKSN